MGEVICCSKNTLLVSSCLWFLISAGATGFLLFAFVGGTGIYLVPPELAYIALISLFGLFFIVSGSALFARLCHNEILLTFSIVMTFITILVTIFGGVFILLYANDISSVSALDDAAFTAQENAENAFFEWATDPNNAADWVSSQNDLKCCGYDAEQLFKDTKDALFTGELCSSTDVNILNISESVCPGGEFSEETCEETLKTTLGVDDNPTFFCKDAIIVFFQDQTMFIGIGFGALVLIQLVAWFAAMRMYWVPFGRGGFMGDDSYDSGLPTKSTGPSASGMDLAAPGPNSFGGGGAGGPGPGGMQTSAFGQRVRNFGNRMSTRMSTRPGGGGGGFGAPSSGFGAPSQGFGGGGAGAGGPPPGGPPAGGFGGGFGGAVKAFGNRVSARFAGKPSFGQARPPPGPPGGAPPSFGGPNAPKFGGSSPGGMGGGSSRGGGGGFGDLPPPNNFGSGGGSGQQAVGGGGFGSKLKGGFSRVSARIQGGFGGFGRNARPPPGPPPGMGGGNSPPGGSRFGVGAPPPSFGGGPPPRGPPSFGGGGGAGGPPQRSAPPQQRAAPRAAPAKKGGFGFGRSGGGSRGGAPAARPPNPMGGGGRGGLLAQIQQGKNLNRTHTNDRSAPQI